MMKRNNPLIKPIVKWVGGKRQLLNKIIPLMNSIRPQFTKYVEPFMGGGAVFFELQPSKAIVNDSNSELINVYHTIREEPEELIFRLTEHEKSNSEEYFYKIRALDRTGEYKNLSMAERAARIIYLNRTCYNGLFRVNAAGYFNTPYGRYKNPSIVNAPTIRAISKYLRKSDIEICNEDYRAVLERLDRKKFVYLDPPYLPISSSASFTGYTEGGFTYEQQIELRDACLELRKRKISFIESNSDCPEIRELYKDFTIETVSAKRAINSIADKRGEINEVLIYYASGQ